LAIGAAADIAFGKPETATDTDATFQWPPN
jgi:hypothetical protein